MKTTKRSKNTQKAHKPAGTDILLYTRVIIRKNREYLTGRDVFTRQFKWNPSPWDAWWTRDKETAMVVARQTGGIMMLFNPVIGEVKVL